MKLCMLILWGFSLIHFGLTDGSHSEAHDGSGGLWMDDNAYVGKSLVLENVVRAYRYFGPEDVHFESLELAKFDPESYESFCNSDDWDSFRVMFAGKVIILDDDMQYSCDGRYHEFEFVEQWCSLHAILVRHSKFYYPGIFGNIHNGDKFKGFKETFPELQDCMLLEGSLKEDSPYLDDLGQLFERNINVTVRTNSVNHALEMFDSVATDIFLRYIPSCLSLVVAAMCAVHLHARKKTNTLFPIFFATLAVNCMLSVLLAVLLFLGGGREHFPASYQQRNWTILQFNAIGVSLLYLMAIIFHSTVRMIKKRNPGSIAKGKGKDIIIWTFLVVAVLLFSIDLMFPCIVPLLKTEAIFFVVQGYVLFYRALHILIMVYLTYQLRYLASIFGTVATTLKQSNPEDAINIRKGQTQFQRNFKLVLITTLIQFLCSIALSQWSWRSPELNLTINAVANFTRIASNYCLAELCRPTRGIQSQPTCTSKATMPMQSQTATLVNANSVIPTENMILPSIVT